MFLKRKKTFYVVTGVKAVSGASATSSTATGSSAGVGVTADALGSDGLPLGIGAKAEREKERHGGFSFSSSSDFVFAYRLRKVTVSRNMEVKEESDYNKGAMLGDREPITVEDGVSFAISRWEDVELKDEWIVTTVVEGGEELLYVFPPK